MPKKLTIFGALAAVVIGAMGVFQNTVFADHSETNPVQHMDATGPFAFDWESCFGGLEPGQTPGSHACDAASLSSNASITTPGAAIVSYQLIRIPEGSRLSLPLTYTPGAWGVVGAACAPVVEPNNDCNADADANVLTGTITADVTARVDLFCNGSKDILATIVGSEATSPWPANGPSGLAPPPDQWNSYDFVRSAASIAQGGDGMPVAPSANAYLSLVEDFPDSFAFHSLDTSSLTGLFLGGSLSVPLSSPVPLHNLTFESSYEPGLRISVSILGGNPANPATNDYQCLDSPQDSVARNDQLVAPAAPGIYPRWNLAAAAADLSNGDSGRVIDLQCVVVGVFVVDDTDADCLQDSASGGTDLVDGNPDQDGDGLMDGIEANAGSCITAANVDADGSDDYEELFAQTRPGAGADGCTAAGAVCVPASAFDANDDTDCDGSMDKPDRLHDEGAGPDIDDTTADDNCPSVSNPLQENEDYKNEYHGVDSSGDSVAANNTNPDQDAQGDACDDDNDNDVLNDTTETGMTIVAWGGFASPTASTVCKGPGVGAAPATPMLINNGDTDKDLHLDGLECRQSARPDHADPGAIPAGAGNGPPSDAFASCQTTGPEVGTGPAPIGVTDPDGCAQPRGRGTAAQCGNAAATGLSNDPDNDQLYQPGTCSVGSVSAVHTSIERFYRTMGINHKAGDAVNNGDGDTCDIDYSSGGTTIAACNGVFDPDSDNDLFTDGVETRFYATSPVNTDSDDDACPDALEIVDINGDRTASSGDQGILASKIIAFPGGIGLAGGIVDPLGINWDFNKDKAISSADQGFLTAVILASLACTQSDPFTPALDLEKVAPDN